MPAIPRGFVAVSLQVLGLVGLSIAVAGLFGVLWGVAVASLSALAVGVVLDR